MGNNLSSTLVPDTSKVVLSPTDRFADIVLVVVWGCAIYSFAMIFTTCALIDRWKGPADKIRVGGGSVVLALLLSTAWPLVMAYIIAGR